MQSRGETIVFAPTDETKESRQSLLSVLKLTLAFLTSKEMDSRKQQAGSACEVSGVLLSHLILAS